MSKENSGSMNFLTGQHRTAGRPESLRWELARFLEQTAARCASLKSCFSTKCISLNICEDEKVMYVELRKKAAKKLVWNYTV